MTPELVKRLKKVESEALALKQASQNGLNSANFFRIEKEETLTFLEAARTLMIVVQFPDWTPWQPFAQLWTTWSTNFPDLYAVWDPETKRLTASSYGLEGDVTLKIKVICISNFQPESITLGAIK